ncbi:MAG TPA: EAL domain-containing protein [Acidimicrobiales bacterium]|nr:EAL domain-containing protein [Acidimicrobiales bacterium]
MSAGERPSYVDEAEDAWTTGIAADLGYAVARGEIHVHYLPVVELASGTVVGVEALARWHRGNEVLDAGAFLDVALKTGAIVPLGRHVIEQACAAVAGWNARHPHRPPLKVAVNLSLHQLLEPDSVEHMARSLQQAGLDPTLLVVEMGEDSLSELGEGLTPTLTALRDLGVRLVVDDFGTGATSLVALQQHPMHALKIDRSFVSRMDEDESAAAIVRGIAHLGQDLGLGLVAEGVERPAQEQMLWSLRCEIAQGWLYARAAEDLDEVVETAAAAAESSLARRPADHHELWTGMSTPGSAARFVEAVFEASPIGMVLIDDTGRHLAVNPAAAELLGRFPAELQGKACWEVVHPTDLREDLAGMEALLRGECTSYVVEERVIDAGGNPRWVEVTVSGLTGYNLARGQSPRLLRQLRSIADERQAGEDAAALRSIIAASPDALVIADQSGRCSHWNPAAEALFGWTEAEMVGQPLTRLVVAPDQLALAHVLADATTGRAVRWEDATWISSTGEPRPVDVTVGPIHDADAGVVGLVALARDATDQRAAHQALREAHRALEAHAGELGVANDRLASFASTLTHDLLQPVAALDGFLMLLDQHAIELEDDHRDWLQRAIRGQARLRDAITALNRAATEQELSLAPLALGPVVDQVLDDLPGGVVELDVLTDHLPIVLADRGLLTQVLANLFQNSQRYRDPSRPLRVAIDAQPDAASWVISVTDNGLGIADDERSSVFERGVRGRSAQATAGTGTGLATVRDLMRRMDGEVWAEPHEGGARICLRLRAAGR